MGFLKPLMMIANFKITFKTHVVQTQVTDLQSFKVCNCRLSMLRDVLFIAVFSVVLSVRVNK
jgi:hypothetical protein